MRLTLLFPLFLALPLPAAADQIKALNRGDQSLAAYYLAIQGAKKSIDVATYVIEPCQSVPKVLLAALLKKAQSGVKVRFVIEAWLLKEPVKTNLPLYLFAQSGGNIEVRIYGSTSVLAGDRPRSHIKAFIVDENTQIVGGRNWTDEYFGVNQKMNYVDQDLLLVGSSARDARKFFDELWRNSTAAVRTQPAAAGPGAAPSQPGVVVPQPSAADGWARQCLAPSSRDQNVARFAQGQAQSVLQGLPTVSCGDVKYVADDPRFMAAGGESRSDGYDNEVISQARLAKKYSSQLWLDFLNGTKSKVSVLNQYYMPWGRVSAALRALREAKKQVEIFANATGDIESPAQNHAFSCWIQRSAQETNVSTQIVHLLTSRGALRDSWSLSVSGAPWRIHAKTGIRDGVDVLVGSWNMDPRSYATNLEDGVLVRSCPALAKEVNLVYEQMLATAKADRYCTACGVDAQAGDLTGPLACGGTPTFY